MEFDIPFALSHKEAAAWPLEVAWFFCLMCRIISGGVLFKNGENDKNFSQALFRKNS